MQKDRTPRPAPRRPSPAALRIGLVLISLFGLCLPGRTQTYSPATVTLNVKASLATIPSQGFGINTAVWDGLLTNSAVPALLQAGGITMMRYPGGSTSDVYHWQTNTMTGGGSSNSANKFDNFMGTVQKTGAGAILVVNYGSNPAGTAGADPSEAAAWVDYANNVKHYGVQYWEIGNEIYGNGEYGSSWEEDLHASHTPGTYGTNVVAFANAMKAKDPTIKVGAVLAAPANWPDGVAPDWNTNVLAACGSKIDFVVVHWYPQNPGGENDATLLASTTKIAGMITKVRALVNQYCGANAANVQILTTETNSVSSNPGRQTVSLVNALFAADNILAWLENGITNVDWWALHNGSTAGNSKAGLYGTANYGDYGFLSNGSSGEPAANTPFPSYYGLQMAHLLANVGDTMLTASSSQILLRVHAARRADGTVSFMLVNTSLTQAYTAAVSISGALTYGTGIRYDYGPGSSAVSSSSATVTGSSFVVSMAPYTVSVLTLPIVTPAADLSSQVQVIRGGYGYVRSTAHFLQSITLTNTGGAVSGPLSLVLDGLTGGTLVKPSGTTAVTAPAGSAYADLPAGLPAGASASLVLEFSGQPKSYTTRVLAGTGIR